MFAKCDKFSIIVCFKEEDIMIMQDPLSIANYVVKYAHEHDEPITNLKLQKILFYLQAAFLVEHNEPLMDTEFSRWQYGPVAQDVYYKFNSYGGSPIDEVAKKVNLDTFEISTPELTDVSVQEELDQYIGNLIKHDAWELVEKTHAQSIWSDHKNSIENYSAAKYKNEEIKTFFRDSEAEQLWKS